MWRYAVCGISEGPGYRFHSPRVLGYGCLREAIPHALCACLARVLSSPRESMGGARDIQETWDAESEDDNWYSRRHRYSDWDDGEEDAEADDEDSGKDANIWAITAILWSAGTTALQLSFRPGRKPQVAVKRSGGCAKMATEILSIGQPWRRMERRAVGTEDRYEDRHRPT
jgi:hypothetical protein